MKSSLETSHPKALDDLREAIQEVVAYRQHPADRGHLASATSRIRSALDEDPDYLRAVYYDAIVDDLSGRSGDAPAKYERVLDSARADERFLQEVRYNLAVAYYHGYHWEALEKATAEFTRVIQETTDPSLKLLSLAGRAQAYAMHTIPPKPFPKNLAAADRDQLAKVLLSARKAKEDIDAVLKSPPQSNRRAKVEPYASTTATWAARNASGMRRMYLADYWEAFTKEQREQAGEEAILSVGELLERARADLEEAEKVRSRDWANWCDIASAYMRTAVKEADTGRRNALLQQAERHMTEVVTVLRPDYGFGLYELGRINRLGGRFQEAIEYFNRSLSIPKAQREVGDTRLNIELERAQKASTEYP